MAEFEGPVIMDAATLLSLPGGGKLPPTFVVFVYNSSGSEVTQSWHVSQDCNLVAYGSQANAQSLISRSAALTLTNYLVNGVQVDQFISVPGTGLSGSVHMAGINWPFRLGDIIYIRQASGAQLQLHFAQGLATT